MAHTTHPLTRPVFLSPTTVLGTGVHPTNRTTKGSALKELMLQWEKNDKINQQMMEHMRTCCRKMIVVGIRRAGTGVLAGQAQFPTVRKSLPGKWQPRETAGGQEAHEGPLLLSQSTASSMGLRQRMILLFCGPEVYVLEPRRWQGWFLLEALGRESPGESSFPCPFQLLEAPTFLGWWPLPPPSKPAAENTREHLWL